ncbi:biotin/lipoyl-containing protein [Anianabacter salinae]|uniref:biotin/lipoyl-containing protein n=1 Tax=Anianabacter salinae TaxID=2851023 RepID=UPI00225E5F7C|nr:biotin/lipoyl-containing protein [Anianabacter salinae]MBV0911827.1 pyruvate dehydrogenase [Anianabacter salinae]
MQRESEGFTRRDVTMPQLGMAQDTGRIVAWLKAQGDAVAKGDVLFEVETDKATMEVEAQASGYLTSIAAGEGDDVPVGQVIARISDSAEDDAPPPAKDKAEAPAQEDDALPEGRAVTMPQLGMAQDSGILVAWLKEPGDAVSADDPLFEVETDKSTMEVPAGADGFLAATLAQDGDAVPVGQTVAIISNDKPDAPVARSVADAAPAPAAPAEAKAPPPAPRETPKPAPAPAPGGRILASPKARRLALEQGLDLARLAEAGHPQPYHVRDLDTLRAMPAKAAGPSLQGAAPARHATAQVPDDGFAAFANWAAEAHGLTDAKALLAGLAASCLRAAGADATCVAIERRGTRQAYSVGGLGLSDVTATDNAPHLILRDLRGSAVRSVTLGPEDVPVLTLMTQGDGLTVTLECPADALDGAAALTLLSEFADRLHQPLRALL